MELTFSEVNSDVTTERIAYYNMQAEVHPAALRHGVTERDIRHAIEHSLVVEEVGEDPSRFLVLGPDSAGNLLEVVVLDRVTGPMVIHAMAMRTAYGRLLGRER